MHAVSMKVERGWSTPRPKICSTQVQHDMIGQAMKWCKLLGGGRTRGHVDGKELPEVGLGVGLGEQVLDGVLEGKVEGLCGEVTDDIGQVATPERGNALLCCYTGEAVANACKRHTYMSGSFVACHSRPQISQQALLKQRGGVATIQCKGCLYCRIHTISWTSQRYCQHHKHIASKGNSKEALES